MTHSDPTPPSAPEQLAAQKQVVLARLFWAQIFLVGALTLLALLVKLSAVPEMPDWILSFGQIGTFWPALLVGSLGGSVALLRRIRADDRKAIVESAASRVAAWMPLLYGGLMAGVAYALFLSQVVSGTLFPAFTDLDGDFVSVELFFEMHLAKGADFGKLIVWSFIAGYSENFVTGLLGRLQEEDDAGGPRRPGAADNP